MFVCQRTVAVV